MESLMQLKVLGHVALAMLLGGLIGFERELADKPAGMRTHMLVAGAAALLVLLGDSLVERFEMEFDSNVIRADPIRIFEAIVTGVAFLGAGTIIRHRDGTAIQGLTTAATLFFTASIGICVALKELGLAVGATVLALVTLRVVYAIEWRLKQRSGKRS